MSSESSPKDRRGKTTLHGVKATPKAMRPVQPDYVYDSYEEDDRAARREERRARRGRTAPDLSTYGMFAFFALLGIAVVFFLVQGGSSNMEFDRVNDTNDEVRAKNEETRKINEQRAREAANRPQPAPAAESRDINIPARQPVAPAVAPAVEKPAPRAVAPQPTQPAPSAPSAVGEPNGEARPSSGGGISAGMVPPELQKKLSTEPRTTIPEEKK